MQCTSCGHTNRDGARFCDGCGAALTLRAGARFCDACGQAVAAAAPARAPETLAGGRYHVSRLLGEGSRKRVYLAHDARLARDVAIAFIKTEGLDEAGLARVRREARAMGHLGEHPHVVTIHDVGEENGHPYIVSQYMSGGSVDALLRSAVRFVVDHCHRFGGRTKGLRVFSSSKREKSRSALHSWVTPFCRQIAATRAS
jgi:serine/threonine protein kinase